MQKPPLALVKYSIAQAFYQLGTVMVMAVAALSGRLIAPSPDLATLPLALSVLGTLLGLFPASLFMAKFGRKAGFVLGTAIGLIGALGILFGLISQSFLLTLLGFFLYGLHQSFIQFLRFAAMEVVDADYRAHALSWILLAGIPAAFLGPFLGMLGHQALTGLDYGGSYLFLAIALTLQLLVLLSSSDNRIVAQVQLGEEARPVRVILKQAVLWFAIIASALSFALMVMLMAAVPVAMKSHGHIHGEATMVLQWHVLGMYIPSFFSGFLIQRLGKKWLIVLGILIMAAQALIAMLGYDFGNFALALILLGVAWNFMYVGGTNLLVEHYRPAEKNKVQAVNDSIVFGLASLATYGAGFLENKIGWFAMNVMSLPILAAALLASFVLLRGKKAVPS